MLLPAQTSAFAPLKSTRGSAAASFKFHVSSSKFSPPSSPSKLEGVERSGRVSIVKVKVNVKVGLKILRCKK